MKRQKQKVKHSNKKKSNQPTQAEEMKQKPTRRDFLKKIRSGAVASAVIGGGGWFLVKDFKDTMQEHDLTRIGNGIPTIVQIHDPQCPKCIALQRETRDALDNFEEGQFQFLVANIRTPKGQALATTHRVSHVTLLIFDAAGKKQEVLVGQNQSRHLTGVFRRHLAKSRNG